MCGGIGLSFWPPQRIKRTLSTSGASGVVDGLDDVDDGDCYDDNG
jgi:hypothetical protein